MPSPEVAALTQMVDFLETVDRCGDSFHPRLELKSQVQGVVSRLVQVAAMKPKPLLLRGFPHVAQLPLPRSGVLDGVRSETPTPTNLRGNLRRNQIGCPSVHRAVAGGVDDHIGWEGLAVAQQDGVLRQSHDIHAGLELDVTVGHELRGADIDVVTGTTA